MKKYLLPIYLLSMVLSGCWNNVELNETRFVTALGIDIDEQGRFVLTVNVLKPSAGTNKKSGSTSGSFSIVQSTGYTMFDAVRNSIPYSGYKLSYHHIRYIALGSGIGKKDLINVLDLFMRDQEVRRRTWVLYVDGRAESLLRAKGTTHDIQPIEMDREMEAGSSIGKYPAVQLIDVMRMLGNKEKVGYLPISTVIHSKKESHEAGAVIFKDGKVITSLDESQTRGLLWVKEQIKSGIAVVPLEKEGQYASIELLSSKVKIKSRIISDQVYLDVIVSPTGNIGSLDSPFPVDKKTYLLLQNHTDQVIKREIEDAVKIGQKYKADIFGFNEYVHRSSPEQWKKWKDRWPEIFSRANVTVSVESHLLMNGLLLDQLGEK
ncbi:Ger(x)C family spore germination protein [Brevibacillus nitrificans]|uniref:Ger(X)C family spore germination protein n=1 Tax=Brevibacillus nitrificans TaxID=651560 RepID=A0A3M8DIZ4_9BACL|nr:Ger(x)C family spore germination protein [Brevibacillus nitrificans]RNB87994.1 Ger(x)C family spore germination protein [Brevibacillus nitrificans]